MKAGLMHVYTGDGKGKTTAATGLAMRALGSGLKVLFVKYLKPQRHTSGEDIIIEKINTTIAEIKVNTHGIIGEYDEKIAIEIRDQCVESLTSIAALWSAYDLLILDEMNIVLNSGFLKAEEVIVWLKNRPQKLEVVLTGRHAPQEIVAMADYVTEMCMRKHPYDSGVVARKGIEF